MTDPANGEPGPRPGEETPDARSEVVAILREKMVVALAEQVCGKKNCEHCRNMVRIFEEAVRESAVGPSKRGDGPQQEGKS